jgi:hypothetical protein
MVAVAEARESRQDVEQLLEGSDADTRLYVLVQQYRQSEGEARRQVAASIHQQFFARFPCPIDIGRQQLATVKTQLSALLADPAALLPPALFDAVATVIFARKRASIVDLTKTVFMDLCVKGIELRALTYDPGLIVSFSSLCDNMDAAAWEEFHVKVTLVFFFCFVCFSCLVCFLLIQLTKWLLFAGTIAAGRQAGDACCLAPERDLS